MHQLSNTIGEKSNRSELRSLLLGSQLSDSSSRHMIGLLGPSTIQIHLSERAVRDRFDEEIYFLTKFLHLLVVVNYLEQTWRLQVTIRSVANGGLTIAQLQCFDRSVRGQNGHCALVLIRMVCAEAHRLFYRHHKPVPHE